MMTGAARSSNRAQISRMSILARDAGQAFCRHTHVERVGAASGALAHTTFGLKDLFAVAGERTGFGNPDWLRTHPPATDDAWVLRVLLAAGASMVGRTHTEELAFSLTGENAHYGTPRNPRAPERVPGGSSSGSAVAVADALVDFAIGSDTGGSVRAPASYCGLYGMRPTHGRLPLDGACPLAPGFDTVGWFAREARLLERVGRVLFDAASRDVVREDEASPRVEGERWRVLVAEDAFANARAEASIALRSCATVVESVYGPATAVTVANEGLRAWFETFRTLQGAEIWAEHGPWITEMRPHFGPRIAPRFAAVASITPDAVGSAARHRQSIRARLDALLGDDGLLVLPTVPDIAPVLDEPAETAVPSRERALALLCIAGLGGLPQVTMPVTTLDGCPLGLSLIGPRGSDERLLATVVTLERHGLPPR
jgi:amidase